MGAYVEHDFEKGFLLGEEQLRKIHDLVNNRISTIAGSPKVIFKVSRGDSYSYTTNLVEDVVQEDNEDWRAIKKLNIIVKEKDIFDFEMVFSKSGLNITITGDDRDSVYLLFSDLREYIKNEVLTRKTIDRDSARLLNMMLLMISTVGVLLYSLTNNFYDEKPLDTILKSQNIIEKLNYLIEVRKPKVEKYNIYMLIGIMAFMLLSITDFIPKAWSAIFPVNEFCFGKRKLILEKRAKFWSNIMWVVIVGAIVSVVAGLAVWKMTT